MAHQFSYLDQFGSDEFPIPYFKEITQTGEVRIGFTKLVALQFDFTYLETAMILIDDVLTPCLEVKAENFEGEELAMEWSTISFDEGELKL